jgi:hypothetical protein
MDRVVLLLASGALTALVVGSGCAGPGRHTPQPYASNLEAAAALETRAVDYCRALHPEPEQQPRDLFVTDGCSLWFDSHWVECCVTHDIAYWCGGTREQRRRADAEFGACIAERTSGAVGLGMRLGVRVGGQPLFPTSYRWGYGHAYRACYPSTEAQRP